MKLSVVIPAYNEAENIRPTVEELLAVSRDMPEIDEVRIIVVDDHSSDDTFSVVSALRDKNVICIRLSRRSGSHTALRAGIKEAKGSHVLIFSADGQEDPACIKEMVREWKQGRTIVWGLRKDRNNEGWLIRFTARVFYKILLWLVDAGDIKIDLSAADFCLIDEKAVEAINALPERNTSLFGLIAWLGFSQGSVEYNRRSRRLGKTRWSFRHRMRLAKDWIIAFSGLPLKLVLFIGISVASAGIVYALSIIWRAFTIPGWISTVPGWSSIMAAVLILCGLQIIIMGVIGEYLWRNLEESRRRPLYFIEATTK